MNAGCHRLRLSSFLMLTSYDSSLVALQGGRHAARDVQGHAAGGPLFGEDPRGRRRRVLLLPGARRPLLQHHMDHHLHAGLPLPSRVGLHPQGVHHPSSTLVLFSLIPLHPWILSISISQATLLKRSSGLTPFACGTMMAGEDHHLLGDLRDRRVPGSRLATHTLWPLPAVAWPDAPGQDLDRHPHSRQSVDQDQVRDRSRTRCQHVVCGSHIT